MLPSDDAKKCDSAGGYRRRLLLLYLYHRPIRNSTSSVSTEYCTQDKHNFRHANEKKKRKNREETSTTKIKLLLLLLLLLRPPPPPARVLAQAALVGPGQVGFLRAAGSAGHPEEVPGDVGLRQGRRGEDGGRLGSRLQQTSDLKTAIRPRTLQEICEPNNNNER